MKKLMLIPALAAFVPAVSAQEPVLVVDVDPLIITPAAEHTLDEYIWEARPIVVFADSPNDPRFVEQMELLTERIDALAERDVVVLIDTTPAERGAIRQELRPRGFMLVVLAKDGSIVTRKPAPWDVREITRSIDKLPLRQQEVRDALNE